MRFHYDKKEDALYLRFNENPYFKSDEVKEGIVFDYDKNGKIIGLEILDVSRRFPRPFKSSLAARKLNLVFDAKAKQLPNSG